MRRLRFTDLFWLAGLQSKGYQVMWASWGLDTCGRKRPEAGVAASK